MAFREVKVTKHMEREGSVEIVDKTSSQFILKYDPTIGGTEKVLFDLH